MPERAIEIGGSKDFGPCDCCGNASRTVWGYISRGGDAEAVYFVQWTMGVEAAQRDLEDIAPPLSAQAAEMEEPGEEADPYTLGRGEDGAPPTRRTQIGGRR